MEYTRYDEPEKRKEAARSNFFETAAFCCGLISVFSCMVVMISFPVGALGITFALLSRTDSAPLKIKPKKALILSVIGMIGSLCIFVIMMAAVIKSYGGWDAFVSEYMNYYEQITGQSLDFTETLKIWMR